MNFTVGQRVRITVNAPAGWPGAYSAPAGTVGSIANEAGGSYGVLIDDDPDQMPASYTAAELRPA